MTRRPGSRFFLASLLALPFVACGEDESTVDLRGESALVSGCYGWPDEPVSLDNNVGGLHVSVIEGERAIDFSLQDVDGVPHRLADLLESRPVLLVLGSFT